MSTRPRSPRISGEPPGKAPTAMEQHKDSNRMSRKVSGLHVLTGMYIRNVRIYVPIDIYGTPTFFFVRKFSNRIFQLVIDY